MKKEMENKICGGIYNNPNQLNWQLTTARETPLTIATCNYALGNGNKIYTWARLPEHLRVKVGISPFCQPLEEQLQKHGLKPDGVEVYICGKPPVFFWRKK